MDAEHHRAEREEHHRVYRKGVEFLLHYEVGEDGGEAELHGDEEGGGGDREEGEADGEDVVVDACVMNGKKSWIYFEVMSKSYLSNSFYKMN